MSGHFQLLILDLCFCFHIWNRLPSGTFPLLVNFLWLRFSQSQHFSAELNLSPIWSVQWELLVSIVFVLTGEWTSQSVANTSILLFFFDTKNRVFWPISIWVAASRENFQPNCRSCSNESTPDANAFSISARTYWLHALLTYTYKLSEFQLHSFDLENELWSIHGRLAVERTDVIIFLRKSAKKNENSCFWNQKLIFLYWEKLAKVYNVYQMMIFLGTLFLPNFIAFVTKKHEGSSLAESSKYAEEWIQKSFSFEMSSAFEYSFLNKVGWPKVCLWKLFALFSFFSEVLWSSRRMNSTPNGYKLFEGSGPESVRHQLATNKVLISRLRHDCELDV